MSERDRKPGSESADYFTDFPEEFEQRPDAPPRDQLRRARAAKASQDALSRAAKPTQDALSRVEAMQKKVEALARGEKSEEGDA